MRASRKIGRLRRAINEDVRRMSDLLVDVQRLVARVEALIDASDRPPDRAPLRELEERRVALDARRARLQLFCAPADGDEPYGIERERAVPEPDPRHCLSDDPTTGTWTVSGTGTGASEYASEQEARARIERDRERWHALRVWLDRLRDDERAALAEIHAAVAEALADAESLAGDAHVLCDPLLTVADDERAWQQELERLDRAQRARIAADDLLR